MAFRLVFVKLCLILVVPKEGQKTKKARKSELVIMNPQKAVF